MYVTAILFHNIWNDIQKYIWKSILCIHRINQFQNQIKSIRQVTLESLQTTFTVVQLQANADNILNKNMSPICIFIDSTVWLHNACPSYTRFYYQIWRGQHVYDMIVTAFQDKNDKKSEKWGKLILRKYCSFWLLFLNYRKGIS